MSPALLTYNIIALWECACVLQNINDMVATIKAATIKSKDGNKDFHEASLPSTSDSRLKDGQLGLELRRTIVNRVLLFVLLSTIGQVENSSLAEQKKPSMWIIWCQT